MSDQSEPPASPPAPQAKDPRPRSTRTGPGRLLVAVYALFALSATARAGVQIATEFSHAPVAYVLSAVAAAFYLVATITLAAGGQNARRVALLSCSVELAGVLAVGTWSLADKATFPDATVWSGYGTGYGYVPLILPVLGLLWLHRTRPQNTPAPAPSAATPATPAGTPAAPVTGTTSATDAVPVTNAPPVTGTAPATDTVPVTNAAPAMELTLATDATPAAEEDGEAVEDPAARRSHP